MENATYVEIMETASKVMQAQGAKKIIADIKGTIWFNVNRLEALTDIVESDVDKFIEDNSEAFLKLSKYFVGCANVCTLLGSHLS